LKPFSCLVNSCWIFLINSATSTVFFKFRPPTHNEQMFLYIKYNTFIVIHKGSILAIQFGTLVQKNKAHL
jgi:hypothetical protein